MLAKTERERASCHLGREKALLTCAQMRRLEGRGDDGRRRNEHTATELENEPILSKLGLYSARNSLNRQRAKVGDRNHDIQKPCGLFFAKAKVQRMGMK